MLLQPIMQYSIIVAGLLVMISSATAQQPPQLCIRPSQIEGFNALPGNKGLIVTDRFRKKFKISFSDACEDLDYNLTMGIKTANALSCVARGDQVLSKRAVGPMDRCRIQLVEPYTAAMEQADAQKFAR